MQCGAVERSISNLRRRMPPRRFVAPCLGRSPLCRRGAAQLLLHLVPGGGHGVGHLLRNGERTHGCGSHDGHTTGLQLAAHMCSPSQQRYPRAPCPAPGAAWTDPAARPDAARAPRREMRTSWMASLRGLGVWAGGRVVRERSKSFVTPKKRAHTMARNRKTCALPEGVTFDAVCNLIVYVRTRKRRSTYTRECSGVPQAHPPVLITSKGEQAGCGPRGRSVATRGCSAGGGYTRSPSQWHARAPCPAASGAAWPDPAARRESTRSFPPS